MVQRRRFVAELVRDIARLEGQAYVGDMPSVPDVPGVGAGVPACVVWRHAGPVRDGAGARVATYHDNEDAGR